MKPIALFAALAAFALPIISSAAPARHTAVKKPVRPAAHAVKSAPATVTALPAGSRPFSDVPPDHWAAAAVETLRQRGIVKGYPAETHRTQ